jgi:hypothetical protein
MLYPSEISFRFLQKKKKTLLASCLFISAFHLNAQDSDLGNWFIYFGNYQLSPRWGVWLEGQYRNYNFIGDLEQAFARTAILFNLPKTNAQWAQGYGFFRTANYITGTDDKRTFNEHRFYQQFITRQRFGRLYLMHRYRLEERFIEGADFKVRFRYFIGANIPLNKPELTPGAFCLSLYNELFINTVTPVFDRNRVYGALGYVASRGVRLEAGWLYQLFENRRRPQLQLVCFHNLDLSKHD